MERHEHLIFGSGLERIAIRPAREFVAFGYERRGNRTLPARREAAHIPSSESERLTL
jgi:hypothetical protein